MIGMGISSCSHVLIFWSLGIMFIAIFQHSAAAAAAVVVIHVIRPTVTFRSFHFNIVSFGKLRYVNLLYICSSIKYLVKGDVLIEGWKLDF